MTVSLMEPREGVLVAQHGEEIACPECGRPLARFVADAPGPDGRWPLVYTEGARRIRAAGGRVALRCECGGRPFPGVGDVGGVWERALAKGPRIFIRSGSWTGWRELGE
jgi:hypothetical protein